MPDQARETLSQIIAKYEPELVTFVNDPHDPSRLTWQANLFREAELLSDGSVFQPSFDNIQHAIGQYLAAGPPKGMNLLTWFDSVGKLYSLVSLPVSQSVEMGAGNVNDMLNIGDDGASIVSAFIPNPFGTGVSVIANQVFSSIEGNISSAANASVGRLEDQTIAAANGAAIQQAYQADPGLVPDSIKAQGSDAVNAYLGNLASPYADTSHLTPAQQEVVAHIQDMDNFIKDAYTTGNDSNF
jgi:hypothetical protein